MSRRERRAAARLSSQSASNGPGAGTATAFHAAGLGHMQAKRYLDARACFEQALALDANHADTLHLMGLLHLQDGQYDLAIEWIARAIRQGSPKPVYLWSLGATLQKQGRHEDALKTFDKAVQLKPDDPVLWTNLGTVLVELDRQDEALLSFQHALKLNPRHWDAADKSGRLLRGLERFEEALAHFNLCDELKPNDALTLQIRAGTLRDLKRLEEALADNRRAYKLDPTNPSTCNNLGDVLLMLGRPDEAVEWLDKALELRRDYAPAIDNKAFALTQFHRFDEAFALYERLKCAGANTAMTDWNLSLLQMLTGDFEAGWAGREARWKALRLAYPKFSEPMWLGKESIEGKTILVHVDEGLGDCIQFARYVPMVAARGARVILVVDKPVVALLSGIPGISQCLPRSAERPAFDMHCPMSSLPLIFQTRLDSIPSGISYLPAPAEALKRAWEDRLGPHDRLRVGLVWSGNPRHTNDHNRSLPLQLLSRVLDLDACFVSLQKDPRASDLAFLRERTGIVDLTEHLTDFTETAALVSCLDLVITVDTSVAHLSAALGQPTWILLPYVPDYRWLVDRDDSPWYPSARLFRQTEIRDYGEVADRVSTALLTLISERSGTYLRDHEEEAARLT
jgi:tetratricopeptide (TPR) repeat protein